MFTSDIKYSKKHSRRMALIYLCITLFCGLFSAVYEYFSFGVYSNYMIFLYMIPLMAGVLPFALAGLMIRLPCPSLISVKIYNCGVATLTLGCCLAGVLEIYGTTSIYIRFYWLAGIVMMAFGFVLYLVSTFLPRKREG